jgi:SAM-dependent methyltransferase
VTVVPSRTAGEDGYAFRNARAIQRERLRTLEALLDPGTVRVLDSVGPRDGWRCLEVGAGGGSIAAWLADRVAPQGAVLATDLDITVAREVSRPNLTVRVHDILRDDLPEAAFDLVHLRLVLAWLTDAERALDTLAGALKPGGWLVAEEMDFISVAPDLRHDDNLAEVFERVAIAHTDVLAAHHDFDPFYGRRLAGDLTDAALADVGCEGRTAMWRGGEPGGDIWRLTLVQLREEMVAAGRVTADEIDRVIALCDDPRFSSLSPVTVAAWGRRR